MTLFNCRCHFLYNWCTVLRSRRYAWRIPCSSYSSFLLCRNTWPKNEPLMKIEGAALLFCRIDTFDWDAVGQWDWDPIQLCDSVSAHYLDQCNSTGSTASTCSGGWSCWFAYCFVHTIGPEFRRRSGNNKNLLFFSISSAQLANPVSRIGTTVSGDIMAKCQQNK